MATIPVDRVFSAQFGKLVYKVQVLSMFRLDEFLDMAMPNDVVFEEKSVNEQRWVTD